MAPVSSYLTRAVTDTGDVPEEVSNCFGSIDDGTNGDVCFSWKSEPTGQNKRVSHKK